MIEMNFERLNDFVGDQLFTKLKNWDRSVNCYEVTGIDETKHSRFFSWLLNPREGHALGDLFVKELLITSIKTLQNMNGDECSDWKDVIKKNNYFNSKSILDIQEMSLQDLVIEVEFPAGDAGSEYGKRPTVDICVFDYTNSLMIVIENKNGSKEKPVNQTKRYRDYLHKRFAGAFENIVYIFIDNRERTPCDLNWIGLGYDWIIDFCKNVIDLNLCSQRSLRIIEDYYAYLSEDDNANLENTSSDDWLLNLANNHKEFISSFWEKKWGNSFLYNITNEEMAKKISGEKDKEKIFESLEFKLWHLYQKHWGIIDNLSKSANLELIKHCLAEKLLLKEDYIDSNPRWVACADPDLIERYTHDTDENWPICVCYYLPKFKKNEHGDMQLEKPGRICIDIYKSNLKTEELDKIKQLVAIKTIWNKKTPRVFIDEYDNELDREEAVKKIVKKFQEMQRLFNSQINKSKEFSEIKKRLIKRLDLDDEWIKVCQGNTTDDLPYIEICDPEINDKYNFKNIEASGITVAYYPPNYKIDRSGKRVLKQNGCGEIAIQIQREKLPEEVSEMVYEIIDNENNDDWDDGYKWLRWYEFETDLEISEIVDRICEKYREMVQLF